MYFQESARHQLIIGNLSQALQNIFSSVNLSTIFVNFVFRKKIALMSPVQNTVLNSAFSRMSLIADKVDNKSLVSKSLTFGSVGKYEFKIRIVLFRIINVTACNLQ